ncbi:MAG: HD-GYP domain-containing protein [Treponema sp.]|nr:HD-GYP domain-containing protein [Treponema sp.]
MKYLRNVLILCVCCLLAGVFALVVIRIYESSEESREKNNVFINLRDFPVYIKKGYTSAAMCAQADLNSGAWIKIPARKENAPLYVKALFPNAKRTFLSPFAAKDEAYTYVVSFQLDTQTMMKITSNKREISGVFLASIGDNWEVFLNGTLLKSELHIGKNGNIASHRSYRKVYFPVDNSLFLAGENQLTFRIVGSPDDINTGFTYMTPYIIQDYNEIPKNNDALTVALCAVYIFMGAYHLALFIIHKKDAYVLPYSLFSTLLGVYFFARTTAVYAFIPNSSVVHRIETGALYMIVPVFAAFCELLTKPFGTLSLFVKIYSIFSVILIVTQALFSLPFRDDTLLVWQITGLAAMGRTFYYLVCFFSATVKKQRALTAMKLPFRAYMHILAQTDFGILFIGSSVLLLTGIIDLLNAMVFRIDIVTSTYSFFLFTIGISFLLARKFRYLYEQVADLQSAILKTMAELVEYRDTVTGSHIERTKLLVEILTKAMLKDRRYSSMIKDWDIELLVQSSQLHDVGKIAIRDSVLRKKSALTAEEFEEMKKHASFGVKVIEQIENSAPDSDFLEYAKIFAGAHHENWDGSGYPNGLKAGQIPLSGRIMAVADVYDALTSVRPYKRAFSHEEAVNTIKKERNRKFDPDIVDIFLSVQEQFRAVSESGRF